MATAAAVRSGPVVLVVARRGRSAYCVSPARRPALAIAGTPIEPAHPIVPGGDPRCCGRCRAASLPRLSERGESIRFA